MLVVSVGWLFQGKGVWDTNRAGWCSSHVGRERVAELGAGGVGKGPAPRVGDCSRRKIKKKSRKIGREQIGFVFLSWMEYFSFTFLLLAVEREFSRLPGLAYSSFPTEKLRFFRTTFLLKTKGILSREGF